MHVHGYVSTGLCMKHWIMSVINIKWEDDLFPSLSPVIHKVCDIPDHQRNRKTPNSFIKVRIILILQSSPSQGTSIRFMVLKWQSYFNIMLRGFVFVPYSAMHVSIPNRDDCKVFSNEKYWKLSLSRTNLVGLQGEHIDTSARISSVGVKL